MIGDLHIHSKLSDGSMGLDDIVFYAKRAGLDFISITDHDTMAGVTRAQVLGKRFGINILAGVEISTKHQPSGNKVHILCYAPQKPDRLLTVLNKTLENRNKAGLQMLQKVMQFYPVTAEHVERYALASKATYKVHIMQALVDLGYDARVYGDLYQKLFKGKDASCLTEVEYPDVFEVLHLVRESGGIAVMAHPGQYKGLDIIEELLATQLLDGVEIYHPRNTPQVREQLCEIAREKDLLVTGGTDFHGYYTMENGNPLGTGITDQENIDKIFKLMKKRV